MDNSYRTVFRISWMSATNFLVWAVLSCVSLGTAANARSQDQDDSQASNKSTGATQEIAILNDRVQAFRALLDTEAVKSDPDRSHRVYKEYVDATCQLEAVKSEPNSRNAERGEDIYRRCMDQHMPEEDKESATKQSSIVAKCPNEIVDMSIKVPTLKAPTEDMTIVYPTLSKGITGTVQICVSGAAIGSSSTVDSNGTFSVPVKALKVGQKVVAQLIKPASDGGKESYGPASNEVTVTGSSCKNAVPKGNTGTAPTLTITFDSSNTMTNYSGTLPNAKSGTIRFCVNDIPTGKTIPIATDGTFNGGSDSFKVTKGDKITAQSVSSTDPPTYGPLSNEVTAGDVSKSPVPAVVMIAGYEQAGYSSLGQNGNAFVEMFYEGAPTHIFTGWGKVRLLSTPQPTTGGIVGTFTNPMGQLTTQSYTNVGQALDFVVGPVYKLGSANSHWSIIAGFGATTPFSSQSAPTEFVAPPPNTVECTTLVTRFSAQNGYSPGLVAAPPGSATCLLGGYTNVAFANQDRSNFLLKYGAGLRTTYPRKCTSGTAAHPCSDSYAVLDLTFGQDEAVSGGRLHGVVFKMDGVLPIPIAGASWLYLFGSAYMRLQGNQVLSPLILQIPTTPVTVPSPTVIVLPLRLPNRDYFRLGIGLDLSQVFCKMSTLTCPNSNTAGSKSN